RPLPHGLTAERNPDHGPAGSASRSRGQARLEATRAAIAPALESGSCSTRRRRPHGSTAPLGGPGEQVATELILPPTIQVASGVPDGGRVESRAARRDHEPGGADGRDGGLG